MSIRDLARLEVRILIEQKLEGRHRTVLRWILARLEDEEPIRVTDLRRELGLCYSATYERVGRALYELYTLGRSNQIIRRYAEEQGWDPDDVPDINRVADLECSPKVDARVMKV